jgi:hypothetical protein
MVETTRVDADIQADIDHIIRMYPPLTHDRPFLDVTVSNRQVTVKGYLRTAITRRYLENALKNLPGVAGINTTGLYSDDEIRLEVGQKMPAGVNCNVLHGVVVLAVPDGVAADKLVKIAQKVPGARAVRTQVA